MKSFISHIFLYQAKEITKKVYSKIMNSMKMDTNKIDTIFMNSENSKTSETYRLLINLSDKINLKRGYIYVALSNISMYFT